MSTNTFQSALNISNLTSVKEKRYFPVILIFSILGWLGLALTIIGPVYVILIGLFVWLANGLLVAALRSEAVQVNQSQLPGLNRSYEEVCAMLGVKDPPHLYVLQAGGALNAFATRHCGREFVVLYSDMLEAFGEDSAEVKFILGHELGHIQRRHILKNLLTLPGRLLPILGNAYMRACESTCDRYGFYAADNPDASVRAMMALAGGKEQGKTMEPAVFASQYRMDRGFFISWYELSSGYPTLSHRVADLLALKNGRGPVSAPRNPLSYIFGLFTLGGNYGGGANTLVTVVVIGMLAAMAIPAFSKVREASEQQMCLNNQRIIESAATEYLLENDEAPGLWEDFIGPGKILADIPVCPAGGEYNLSFVEGEEGPEPACECAVHGDLTSYSY